MMKQLVIFQQITMLVSWRVVSYFLPWIHAAIYVVRGDLGSKK